MTPIKPRFVIMAAGFRSGSLVHKNCYESPISIPSLHISGTSDLIIPHEMALLLESGFEYPKKIHHAGGHFFPASSNEKQTYIEFIQNQTLNHLEDKELKGSTCSVLEDDDSEN